MIQQEYVRFDWVIKRLLRQKADSNNLEGLKAIYKEPLNGYNVFRSPYRYLLSWLWLLFFLGWIDLSFAQTATSTKKVIPEIEVNNLVQGRFYTPYYPDILGSQFLTESWVEGDFQLLDKDYLALPLTYDLYIDDLILLFKNKANFHYIRLHKNQVQQFRMGQQFFINLAYSSYKNTGLKEGYYEVMLQDKLSYLIKRQVERMPENGVFTFERSDKKYLIISGKAHLFSNKKNLLAAIGKEYKKPLNTFIKNNKIYLRKASDADWTKIVVYLNGLI